MSVDRLLASLHEFSSQLDEARDGATGEEQEAFSEARAKVSNILVVVGRGDGPGSAEDEFSALSRYVSDSLPWSEEILREWYRVRRCWSRYRRSGI